MLKNLIGLILCIVFYSISSAQLIEDFTESTITNEIYRPLGIRFDQIGRAFVWEKSGVVHVIDSSGVKLNDPLIDISEEVGKWGDHGCLGFALDPDFLENGHFYLFYVVDRHHLLYYGTPTYSPDSTITYQATIGRITRYTADPANDLNTAIQSSRKVLLGETIETGVPILIASHGVGSLVFGTDGTLLASCGEGGSFLMDDYGSEPGTYYQQALDDGIIIENENVGSFRSQMIDALNGKILRLDPQTGDGISSNPWYNSDQPRAPRSRVYALGFRNPFRFIVRPNTGSHNPDDGKPGTLYIGDVGSDKWEELNVCDEPGMNFGFPLYEGIFEKPAFWISNRLNPFAPNLLFNAGSCDKEYFDFQELIKQPQENQSYSFPNNCDPNTQIDPSITFIHTTPKVMYANALGNKPVRAYIPGFDSNGMVDSLNLADAASPVPGHAFGGYTSIPGLFYQGDNFPEEYQGRYFHADYSWWIKTMDFDDNNVLHQVDAFHNHSDYILDLAINPKDGCIYYVNYHSKVHRICYGGNNPPVAVAKYDLQYGQSPLTVNFNGSESYDPDGTILTYLWDFDNGNTSTLANPSMIFETVDSSPEKFECSLTVTDSLGATDYQTFIISSNNTPPEVEISSFEEGDYYSVNGYHILPLAATVTDQEHDESQLSYSWTTLLKHNTHEHSEEPDTQKVTSAIIEPIGCGDETYWYQIQLEVTDREGLVGRDTANIFPFCDDPFFVLKRWEGYGGEQGITLEWEALVEADLLNYTIQRITSEYGVQNLGTKLPEGINTTYKFFDDAPTQGYNNYRLKVYRADGIFDFSPEIRIFYPPLPAVVLFPNPASNIITFQLLQQSEPVLLEVFNAAGAKVLEDTFDSETFEVYVGAFATGIYSYRLKNGQSTHTGKFLKAN